jgi:NAD(P)-dependent dehydrogenase (short-subunit alcohol dehydrogenase family)
LIFFFWVTNPGAVLARQFAALGAKLILSARNKEELERVKNEITSKFQIKGSHEFMPVCHGWFIMYHTTA